MMLAKKKMRIRLDVLMFFTLFLVMGVQFFGSLRHEIFGTAMFLFVALHLLFNRKWFAGLLCGSWNAARIFRTVLNISLVADIVCVMASGMMLSRHLFAFFPFDGGMSVARKMHLSATSFLFVLAAFHLGLHANGIVNRTRRFASIQNCAWVLKMLLALDVLGLAYGIFAFIKRDVLDYLFLRTLFPFLDAEEPKILFYADYAAMFLAFASISFWMVKILAKISKNKESSLQGK